jgi:glycosyltransferase involved in cell wall biosynthesis
MKSLSIIVPMYNVEPYVERCLLSLENQDIAKDDYEILCINDGSPDDCRGIVLRLQQKFTNLILIDQTNQGVSCARNKGIDLAQGTYIMFIDPDDYIVPNTLGQAIAKASLQQIQVLFLGFTFLKLDGTVYKHVRMDDHVSKVYEGTKAYFLARRDGKTDPDRMVAVLFDRGFINRYMLRYLPDVPYLEDGEFIARILCLANRCLFDDRAFYQRTTRPGSATNSNLFNTDKAIYGFLLAAQNLKNFQENYTLNVKQRNFLNQPMSKFALLTLNSALQRPYLTNYLQIRKKLHIAGFKLLKSEGVVYPYTYLVCLYNYFPFAYLISAIFKSFKQMLKPCLRFLKRQMGKLDFSKIMVHYSNYQA